MFSFAFSAFGQEETEPLLDKEVVRKVYSLDIEGELYHDVKVTMKSISPDGFFTDKYRVKVTVEKEVDGKKKKIWRKTLKNAFLYVFSNGQIQIGQLNFDQIVIFRSPFLYESFEGRIRIKEGVYSRHN